jgi:hypothetical protein
MRQQFAEDLARFHRTRALVAPTPAHLVPDIVLDGFLNELHENAEVAAEIAMGRRPHRAFPNARSAFEAMQLALLLVTSDDYDQAGARAWIYYLKKDREFSNLHSDAESVLGLSPQGRFNAAVEEIASTWDDFARGQGALIHEAVPIVEKQPKRPDNWAGVPVAPTLASRMEKRRPPHHTASVADPARALANAYAALNRGTHPRATLRPERISRDKHGRLTVEYESRVWEDDQHTSLVIAAGALNLGTLVIGFRLAIP